MLGNLFYIFVLFGILLNVSKVSNWFKHWKIILWTKVFKDQFGKLPIKSDYRNPDEWQSIITFGVITIYETLIIIFGLITNAWYIYMGMVIFNIISGILLKTASNNFVNYFGYTWTLIKTIILTFLFINHFHLHLDIWNILLK